ncbi:MAG: lipoprotein [Betaproteobacteria bacterium]|jgi:predicted small lipoprotein YifL|nr:lipoprotein [Betaproteobacteria bacterium]MCH9849906.1 lipoprotein [Betaproteobacteria bacterium]MDG1096727.1 lipoprotein [Methylophilaceae bacterium]MDG1454103.1 lipoprotein [Methylophilaceae bacterium]
MFKPLLTVVMISIYTMLIGCGTTGPLYIPEERYPLPDETQPAPAGTTETQPNN